MITGFHAGDSRTDLLDDASAFVTQDHREHSFRIGSGQSEGIRVADTGRHDANQNFAGFRSVEIDLLDAEWFIRFKGNSRSRLHYSKAPR